MEPGVGDASRWRQRLLVLLAALAAVNLAVLAIRIVSLSRGALWLQMPNAEPMNVYALWKLRNGYPLYESAGHPFISFTPYNFLFYYTYGAVMALLRVSGPELSFWSRLPTLASAGAGAWILYRTTVRLSVRVSGTADRPVVLLLSFVSWLGCGVVGWSSLAVRPDISAAMMTIAAVSVSLSAVQRTRASWPIMATAGLLFAGAWAFKHAYIASFVGTVAYTALVRRRPTELVALIVPYAAVIYAALSLGSPGYYYAIFGAQSQDPVRIHEAQFWLRAGLLPNLLIWIVPARHAADLIRRWRSDGTRPPDAFVYLAFVSACVSALTLMIIGKLGASEHYLIEANVLGTLWAGVAVSEWTAQASGARRLRLAAWAAVPMLIFVLAVLTRADVVRDTIGLRARGDRLTLGIPGELARRQTIAERMAQLPAPVYIDDQALGEPWFATRGRFPAPVVVVPTSAYTKGLSGQGMESLISERYFPSLLLAPDSPFAAQAVKAGYGRRGVLPAPAGGVLDIYTR